MRIALKLLLLLFALPVLGQTNRFPLNRAYLQGDMDGGGKSITNISNLIATNNILTAGLSVSNPASAGNGGNTETLSISGNTAVGGFLDYFQSDPSAFSLNVAGGRYVRIPATLNIVGAETMTGGIITSDISETNGAGTTTIHGVASTGTLSATNFVTTTTAAGVGQFIGNGGGLSNVLSSSVVGTITNISGNAGNLTNILRSYITPFEVGAIGDGSTDDTAAMQKWLAIACWSNWVAYLPPAPGGFYKITDVLQITNGQNSIRIQGAGGSMHTSDSVKSKCCIAQFGVAKDGIVITNVQSNVSIDGILVTNGSAYNYATRGIAFDGNVGNSDCSTLKNCGIEGFGKGLFLASMADLTVLNCSFGINGEGVFQGAGTYTPSPVLNNNSFIGCQISYNRSNNIFCSAGTMVVISSDIAQAAIGPEENLCRGAYLTNGYLTAIGCNFENDIGAANAQPCIVATSASSSGGVVLIGGSGGGGGGGANAYSLVVTNVPTQIRGWVPVGVGAADGSYILENISLPGISLVRSDMPIPIKIILNSTVFATEQIGPLTARNCFGSHSQIAKNDFLFLNHSTWIDSNGVSQGGFDDISSLLVGARLNGYAGNNNLLEIDYNQYAKDRMSQAPLYNLYLTNAMLIGSNAWASIGTRIANNFNPGNVLIGSSNGVPVLVTSDASGNKATNYFALSILTKPPADATKYLDGTGAYSVPTGSGSPVAGSLWATNGNQAPNSVFLGIIGFTNGNNMERRMDVNGQDGSTVEKFQTVGNNNAVNMAAGSTNAFGTANFCAIVWGGENNSTANGVTDPAIFGGRFNSIGANGNQAIVIGGGTNTANGAYSVAAGQAMNVGNNNTFGFNGIPNLAVSTSGASTEGTAQFYLQNGLIISNSAYGKFQIAGTAINIATNLMPIGSNPDFNYGVQLFSTNNHMLFLAPTNVDTTKTLYQKCTVFVTNTTASLKSIACNVSGVNTNSPGTVNNVTNLTRVEFEQYGQKFTNMFCRPIF